MKFNEKVQPNAQLSPYPYQAPTTSPSRISHRDYPPTLPFDRHLSHHLHQCLPTLAPPGARGIYGGAAIAQSLSAAQATIPTGFVVHSMHCYFVLAGDSEIPVVYEVERVRDGKSFATRTVQARQRGRCIFTTTISFMMEGNGKEIRVEHQSSMPDDVEVPPDGWRRAGGGRGDASFGSDDGTTPFESVRCKIFPGKGGKPEEKRTRQWIRARGRISAGTPRAGAGSKQHDNDNQDNHQAHLSALAYMSDSYFIGTVARVHNIRFSSRSTIERTLRTFSGTPAERAQLRAQMEKTAREEDEEHAAFEAARSNFRVGQRPLRANRLA